MSPLFRWPNSVNHFSLTVIVTALVTRKDLCEVRIRTGQTEVTVFTAYESER
ncbi:protein hokC [Escherichia coli]|nr:protein hokC [Escherichia coli]RQN49828.1 protein hokC [Escherichia coli]HAW3793026.1 type I toxin-antitoxin system Hok family toxin [Escherichia coli]HDQ1543200.1 type I toxin-antitoxin system Hok family toxin [Escherichia coli]